MKCRKCGRSEPDVRFWRDKRRKSGYREICTECKVGRPLKRDPLCRVIIDGKKRCASCRQDKPVEEFWRRQAHSTGLTSACKACQAPNPIRLSSKPLLDWWLEQPDHVKREVRRDETMARRMVEIKNGQRTINLHTVDRLSVALGDPDLINRLYPL